jgi:hypothetical protein
MTIGLSKKNSNYLRNIIRKIEDKIKLKDEKEAGIVFAREVIREITGL